MPPFAPNPTRKLSGYAFAYRPETTPWRTQPEQQSRDPNGVLETDIESGGDVFAGETGLGQGTQHTRLAGMERLRQPGSQCERRRRQRRIPPREGNPAVRTASGHSRHHRTGWNFPPPLSPGKHATRQPRSKPKHRGPRRGRSEPGAANSRLGLDPQTRRTRTATAFPTVRNTPVDPIPMIHHHSEIIRLAASCWTTTKPTKIYHYPVPSSATLMPLTPTPAPSIPFSLVQGIRVAA